ncbi:hypothetical protein B5G12_02930 [Faecalibacterium sp. An58]|nr:hypothetical protein B5G12_02930 [Faecalibacterium sp. An58]
MSQQPPGPGGVRAAFGPESGTLQPTADTEGRCSKQAQAGDGGSGGQSGQGQGGHRLLPTGLQDQFQPDDPRAQPKEHGKQIDHQGAEGGQAQQQQDGGAPRHGEILGPEQAPDRPRLVQGEKALPAVQIGRHQQLLAALAAGQHHTGQQGAKKIGGRQHGAVPRQGPAAGSGFGGAGAAVPPRPGQRAGGRSALLSEGRCIPERGGRLGRRQCARRRSQSVGNGFLIDPHRTCPPG